MQEFIVSEISYRNKKGLQSVATKRDEIRKGGKKTIWVQGDSWCPEA